MRRFGKLILTFSVATILTLGGFWQSTELGIFASSAWAGANAGGDNNSNWYDQGRQKILGWNSGDKDNSYGNYDGHDKDRDHDNGDKDKGDKHGKGDDGCGSWYNSKCKIDSPSQ